MNIIENIQKTVVPEMDWDTEKNISYTQFSAWSECPHRWAEMYIDKIKTKLDCTPIHCLLAVGQN